MEISSKKKTNETLTAHKRNPKRVCACARHVSGKFKNDNDKKQ
jgi:hypothetical protein